jgi:hypothetical protein
LGAPWHASAQNSSNANQKLAKMKMHGACRNMQPVIHDAGTFCHDGFRLQQHMQAIARAPSRTIKTGNSQSSCIRFWRVSGTPMFCRLSLSVLWKVLRMHADV